ncbi:hypothetical protein CGRA01v4_09283 [Colletotrichum graminicola]|nr:hypothetical protein CGRA01v4_09283 [Colletotrichum graminicola]
MRGCGLHREECSSVCRQFAESTCGTSKKSKSVQHSRISRRPREYASIADAQCLNVSVTGCRYLIVLCFGHHRLGALVCAKQGVGTGSFGVGRAYHRPILNLLLALGVASWARTARRQKGVLMVRDQRSPFGLDGHSPL